jgi:DNA-binding MarR family transcriptional regulator
VDLALKPAPILAVYLYVAKMNSNDNKRTFFLNHLAALSLCKNEFASILIICIMTLMTPAMINIEKSVGFLLAKAYQRACAIFKVEFDNYELTPQQFGLLAFLWGEDGLSQTELAARSQIDRTTIGGIVDRLEKEGLVKRIPHPDDRRAYQVFLTAKGEALENELCTLAIRAQARVNTPLTAEEQATLIRLLEKIRH